MTNQPDTKTTNPDPKKRLYNALNSRGDYTKSYEDFVKQFSTEKAARDLHSFIAERGSKKSWEDFQTTYYPELSEKKKDVPTSSGESSSGSPVGPEVDPVSPDAPAEPDQAVPTTSGIAGASVAGAMGGKDPVVTESDDKPVPELSQDLLMPDLTPEQISGEEEVVPLRPEELTFNITPELLINQPEQAVLRYRGNQGRDLSGYLADLDEHPDALSQGELYVRGLSDLAATDNKIVKEFKAANGENMVNAFEQLKLSLHDDRIAIAELQRVIEQSPGSPEAVAAEQELNTLMSDPQYQEREDLYNTYIEDLGFAEYQSAIERLYGAQLANEKFKESYPEYYQQLEEEKQRQQAVDQLASVGLRPRTPSLTMGLPVSPEIDLGFAKWYRDIEVPFMRTVVESLESIASTPGIVMSALDMEEAGARYVRNIDRLIDVNQMIPQSSDVQRGLREDVGRIEVNGNSYQVVMQDDEPVAVRDANGYLVFDKERSDVLEEWENTGGAVTRQTNWGQVVPMMSSATAQIATTILLTKGVTNPTEMSSQLGQKMAGAGTLTAQLVNGQYRAAINELGVENADLAARYALASSMLMSTVNMAINPIEAGIANSINANSLRVMKHSLNKTPGVAYRAGMLEQAKGVVNWAARYSKGVVSEGFEGLAEQGVDLAARMVTNTAANPYTSLEIDASMESFATAFVEEALGSMFVNAPMTTRANFQQEALYSAFNDRARLDNLDKAAQKHYNEVFARAESVFAGKSMSDKRKASILAVLDTLSRNQSSVIDESVKPKVAATESATNAILEAEAEGYATEETYKEVEDIPTLLSIEESRNELIPPMPGAVMQDEHGRSIEVIDLGPNKVTLSVDGVQEEVTNQEWGAIVDSAHDMMISKYHPEAEGLELDFAKDLSQAAKSTKRMTSSQEFSTSDKGNWTLDDHIMDFFVAGGRVSKSSYSEHGDPNFLNDSSTIGRRYVAESGDSIDMIAETIAAELGLDPLEVGQRIIEVINDNQEMTPSEYAKARMEEWSGETQRKAEVQEVIDAYEGRMSELKEDLAKDPWDAPEILQGLTSEDFNEIEANIDDWIEAEPKVYEPGNENIPERLKGVSEATGATIILHKDSSTLPGEAKDQPVRGVRDPKANSIHINLSLEGDNTVFHEGAHAAVEGTEADVDALFKGLVGLKGGKSFIKFAARYGDLSKTEVREEAVAEYMADVAAGKIKVEKTVWQKILDFFGSMGVNVRSADHLSELAQTYADSVRTGTAMDLKQVEGSGLKFQKAVSLPGSSVDTWSPQFEAARALANKYKGMDENVLAQAFNKSLGIPVDMGKDIARVAKEKGELKYPGWGVIDKAVSSLAASMGKDFKPSRAWARKMLASRGASKEVQQFYERREGAINREVELTMNRVNKVRKMMKPQYKSDFDAYMRGDQAAGKRLPKSLVDAANSLRASIDVVSEKLITEGHVTGVTAEIVKENLGSYLTRAYRVHYDKGYKPSKEVYRAAVNFMQNNLFKLNKKRGMSDEDALRDAKKVAINKVDDLLYRHKKKEQKAGSTASRDVGVLKTRQGINADFAFLIDEVQATGNMTPQQEAEATEFLKEQYAKLPGSMKRKKAEGNFIKSALDDIRNGEADYLDYFPTELRDLLGEMTDPLDAYAMTMFRVVNLLETSRYLASVTKAGLGVFIWEANDPNRPEGANADLAGEGSITLRPLNGLKTTEEGKELILGQIEQLHTQKWLKAWQKANSFVNFSKTVLSPATQVKNVLGNLPFMAANWMMPNMGVSAAAKSVFSNNEGKFKEILDTMKRLGVIDQNITTKVFKEVWSNPNPEGAVMEALNPSKARRKFNAVVRGPGKLYQFGDDIFKASAFISEAARHSEALFGKPYSELNNFEKQEVDGVAAEKVKNTLPNYNRLGELTKNVSKNLLFGNFVAFLAESYRVTVNSMAYAMSEMKSPNPKIRAIGSKRIIGTLGWMAAKHGLMYSAGLTISGWVSSFFEDDEEDQRQRDVRLFVLPHQDDSDLIITKAEDGVVHYFEASGLDPKAAMNKALNAALIREEPDKWVEMAREMLGGYVDPTILVDVAAAIYSNKDVYGRPVYNESETSYNKTMEVIEYIARAAGPGAYNTFRKIADAEDDNKLNEIIGQFTGVKFYPVDVAEQFNYRMADLYKFPGGKINNAFAPVYKAARSGGDVHAALEHALEISMPHIDEMKEMYDAALRLGADAEVLREHMEDKLGKTAKAKFYFIVDYITGVGYYPPVAEDFID